MAEKRRMTPVELVDKVMSSEHADVVRDSVAWVAAEIMEAEVAAALRQLLPELLGAAPTRRAGLGGGRPGGLHQRRLDQEGRPARRAAGDREHEQGPGVAVVPRP